jgi:hypothetical protein
MIKKLVKICLMILVLSVISGCYDMEKNHITELSDFNNIERGELVGYSFSTEFKYEPIKLEKMKAICYTLAELYKNNLELNYNEMKKLTYLTFNNDESFKNDPNNLKYVNILFSKNYENNYSYSNYIYFESIADMIRDLYFNRIICNKYFK